MFQRPVTWTIQGFPETWLGHHNGKVVCARHAEQFQADENTDTFEALTESEIFDFEYDMGSRIVTIAMCFDIHVKETVG